MINYPSGDIFTSNAQALVNPVNCVGIMGKGLALAFKQRFPENYQWYVERCKNHQVFPGRMSVYTYTNSVPNKHIINFPTKRHWKDRSELVDIELGLNALVITLHRMSITSVALPKLGCGLGGLDWESQVKPLMEEKLSSVEIYLEQYLSPVAVRVFVCGVVDKNKEVNK